MEPLGTPDERPAHPVAPHSAPAGMTRWEVEGDFFGTVRELLRRPAALFRTMDPARPARPAVGFGVMAGSIGSIASVLWQTAAALVGFGLTEVGDPASTLLGAAVSCAVAPAAVLVGILLGGAATHAGLVLLGGARHGLGATVAASAYAQAPQVLAVVPVLGALAAFAWSFALAVIGVREVHGTSTLRAFGAVVLPLVALASVAAAIAFVLVRALVP